MKKLSKFFIFFLTLSYQASSSSTMAINSEKSSPLFSPSLINQSNFCPISKPHLSSSPTSSISFEDLNRHVILYRQPPTTPPRKGVSLGVAIAGWSSLAVVLLLVLLALLYCIHHHLRKQLALQNQTVQEAHQAPPSPQPSSTVPASNQQTNQTVQAAAHQIPTTSIEVEDITGPSEGESELGSFTFAELEAATSGFSVRVGRGGCGSVYRGRLDDDRDVAVKVLKQVPGAEAAFDREIELLDPIRSDNVAALLGHLSYGTRRMLVYEFVLNHTLDYHLHDEAAPLFTWERRMQAAIGVARGLISLHEGNLIHSDIKPENILMDNQFNPKIIDFGLVKHSEEVNDGSSRGGGGTPGYVDPEYAQIGQLSQLSDVYSFGVVLLELVAGRRAIIHGGPNHDPGIVKWAEPLIEQYEEDQATVVNLVDKRLKGAYDNIQLEKMISTAKTCVELESDSRPQTMREALDILQGASSSHPY